MSAALDAAATVAIYLAWAVVIVGGVIAIAAFASRWRIPKPLRPVPDVGEEEPEAPRATTGTPEWNWPLRSPLFDPESYLSERDRLLALRRAWENGATFGTTGRAVLIEPRERLTVIPYRTAEALGITEGRDGWTRIERGQP